MPGKIVTECAFPIFAPVRVVTAILPDLSNKIKTLEGTSATPEPGGKAFEKELLMNGNVDLEIAYKNGFWINGPPLGIYGNPGFGKTIYLRQFGKIGFS